MLRDYFVTEKTVFDVLYSKAIKATCWDSWLQGWGVKFSQCKKQNEKSPYDGLGLKAGSIILINFQQGNMLYHMFNYELLKWNIQKLNFTSLPLIYKHNLAQNVSNFKMPIYWFFSQRIKSLRRLKPAVTNECFLNKD